MQKWSENGDLLVKEFHLQSIGGLQSSPVWKSKHKKEMLHFLQKLRHQTIEAETCLVKLDSLLFKIHTHKTFLT